MNHFQKILFLIEDGILGKIYQKHFLRDHWETVLLHDPAEIVSKALEIKPQVVFLHLSDNYDPFDVIQDIQASPILQNVSFTLASHGWSQDLLEKAINMEVHHCIEQKDIHPATCSKLLQRGIHHMI